MVPQTTLVRSTSPVTGTRLDQDALSTVRFHPAAAGTGVVFVRRDVPGEPRVECGVEHVGLQPRWSSLEQSGIVVHFTEHILAALAGCNIDNVLVELDSNRVPVVTGGSCLGFAEALAAGGVETLDAPRTVFRLKRPIHFELELDVPVGAAVPSGSARRYIQGVPADTFAASYVFQVPAVAGMRVGLAEFEQERDDFTAGIGRARTYYLQVEKADVSGLLSSARHEYIVLHAESSQADVDEVARHKLMDLWGDLRLLGKPVWGRFAAFRTGHRFHHDLIRKLAGEDYLETIELTDTKEFA
jgi:UDP-3-O-acyl-N-acetylglucosamine deacetylase